jgi:hypothetical protein
VYAKQKKAFASAQLRRSPAARTAAENRIFIRIARKSAAAIFAAAARTHNRCKSSVAFLKRVKVSHFEQALSAFYRERANGCVPRLLVSFVGRRFSVSPSRDHREEMLGGWGCRKRQLTYFIAARHQNRSCAAPFLIASLRFLLNPSKC